MDPMVLKVVEAISVASCNWAYLLLLLFILFTGLLIRWYASPRRKIRVECWFCQTKTKVPRSYANDWMCSECKQYNGFSKDGGYRKAVPGQVSNGPPARFCRLSPSVNFSSHSNILCRSCTANQQLKVQQLARFEPLNEDNFDEELAAFRIRLEESLRLCPDCSTRTRHVIRGCDRRVLPRYVEWQRSKSQSPSSSPKKLSSLPRLPCLHLPSSDSLFTVAELMAAVSVIAAHFVDPKWRAMEGPMAWGCLSLLMLRVAVALFSAESLIVPSVLVVCWSPVLLLVVSDLSSASVIVQREALLVKSLSVMLFMVAVLTKKRFARRTIEAKCEAEAQECESMEVEEAEDSSMEMDTASPLRNGPHPPASDVTFHSCRIGSSYSNGSSARGLIRPSRLSSVLGSMSTEPLPPSEPCYDLNSLLSFPPSASMIRPPSPSLYSAPAQSSRSVRTSPSLRSSPTPSVCSHRSAPLERPLWQQVLVGLALGVNGALVFYWCILPFVGNVLSRL